MSHKMSIRAFVTKAPKALSILYSWKIPNVDYQSEERLIIESIVKIVAIYASIISKPKLPFD